MIHAARKGKSVKLIVGLNICTDPKALQSAHNIPNLEIRYYASPRFHAKIYVFDDAALVGSSNLTSAGLCHNREATVRLDAEQDPGAVDDVRALFSELWDFAEELTPAKLAAFVTKQNEFGRSRFDPDSAIAAAVGQVEPPNINVRSTKKAGSQLYLKQLRHLVYGQYRPAFQFVMQVLRDSGHRRPELAHIGEANETNLFLSWVRLTYAPGEETWQAAPLRDDDGLRSEITRLGTEWGKTDDAKVAPEYLPWLGNLKQAFGTRSAVEQATKEHLTDAIMSIHAFHEQLRFVKGGAGNLPNAFWSANNNDTTKVKKTLAFLLYGDDGDFTVRLHDVLYDPARKLSFFGRFCALELYGTVKPNECPPLNGRIAKGLRYLGFTVPGD